MLGHKRIPSREGGVEIVVEELATRMVALGHSVICYNRRGHHIGGKQYDQTNTKEYKGVKLKSVLTINAKGLAAMSSSFFASVRCAFGKYDVVHFHAEGPCAMLWLPKLFGKRCIATIHGLDHQRAKWGKFASLYIMFGEKCAVKYADEIIVLSKNVQDYFEKTYGRKTIYIPNGVTPVKPVVADMITKKYDLNKDDYFLYLARLVPEKGAHNLLEAYKQLDTNKRLVIAGGGSDTDEYAERLRRLAADDKRIIFTGFVQGQELEELYSNAYVYVLPSDLEGMPLSLLEAMSYGNCCLVSDIEECTEVVQDKAIVFKRGSEQSLSEKMKGLIDDETYVNDYKAVACDYICSKYNWDEVVKQTLCLYGE